VGGPSDSVMRKSRILGTQTDTSQQVLQVYTCGARPATKVLLVPVNKRDKNMIHTVAINQISNRSKAL